MLTAYSSCSYGDPAGGNLLIHADNLPALEALEANFAGTVKCIYIDPPFNTGAAFEHYNDRMQHALWLEEMRKRLVILRTLLRSDGFICIHIDDSEGPYLKMLLDEVFGRNHYLVTFYVRVRYPGKTLKQDMDFHKEVEQIHIYRKSAAARPVVTVSKADVEKYRYYVEELSPGEELTLGGKKVIKFRKGDYRMVKGAGTTGGLKQVWASGSILDGNSSGRFFRDHLAGRPVQDGLGVLYKVYGIGNDALAYRFFTGPQRAGATKGKYYQGVPLSQLHDSSALKRNPIRTFYDLAASFGNCRGEGGVAFRCGKKPEKLLYLILSHFSSEGDLVLDCYLGSGSTCAAAHKMNRRWIGIERGAQAHTHCLPRLQKIVDGTDATGITAETGWKGGGGFTFITLDPAGGA